MGEIETLQKLDIRTVAIIAGVSISLTLLVTSVLFTMIKSNLKKVLNKLDIFEIKIGILDSFTYKQFNSEWKEYRDSETKRILEERGYIKSGF